jgi:hypothetical protein
MACSVTTEGDASGTTRGGKKEGHPCEHPLEAAFERVQPDLHGRIFPKQNVMFEIDAGVAEFEVQCWNEFAFDVIRDTAERFVLYVCGK